jgi:hypothetical protein
MRRKIIMFLHYKVFRKPEASVMNKFCKILYSILYPLRASYEKQAQVHYDFLRDTYTLAGIKYSRQVFKFLGDEAKEGTLFMFIKREDGSVTIKTITSPLNVHQN